ncbi:MAG: glycosyltransferase family 2 protein [Paludibacter sp.]|nr:glycosyltransferase family 2 protein [Paludibacter sp.]
MPRVSVIVPNYNHAPYLRQRIDSILNQTYQDFELILLDDCSTDKSEEVLLSYKDHTKVTYLIFNKQNSGSTFKQWNKGIGLAKGEYIWIAESDDWAETGFLEKIIVELEKRENIGLAYVASKLINSDGEVTYENKSQDTNEIIGYTGSQFLSEKLVTSNNIWNASMMVFKKELFYNLSDKSYLEMKYCGDWFLYVQLCEQTNVLEIKSTLNNYRIHADNVSTDAKRTGKYFTEGFRVFEYITHIKGVSIPLRSLYDWAKMYQKAKDEYQFSKELKHDIVSMFVRYNPLINIFVYFRIILCNLKKV